MYRVLEIHVKGVPTFSLNPDIYFTFASPFTSIGHFEIDQTARKIIKPMMREVAAKLHFSKSAQDYLTLPCLLSTSEVFLSMGFDLAFAHH